MGYLYMDGLSMFIMENPIKVDDLGIPLFQETPNYILWHILWYILWYKIYIYIYGHHVFIYHIAGYRMMIIWSSSISIYSS